VVKLALRHNAAAVILAHNHPSGETEPKKDRNITQHLVNALAMVEVRVLDHLIVGTMCFLLLNVAL
jgi:DNA repair protein RadC